MQSTCSLSHALSESGGTHETHTQEPRTHTYRVHDVRNPSPYPKPQGLDTHLSNTPGFCPLLQNKSPFPPPFSKMYKTKHNINKDCHKDLNTGCQVDSGSGDDNTTNTTYSTYRVETLILRPILFLCRSLKPDEFHIFNWHKWIKWNISRGSCFDVAPPQFRLSKFPSHRFKVSLVWMRHLTYSAGLRGRPALPIRCCVIQA